MSYLVETCRCRICGHQFQGPNQALGGAAILGEKKQASMQRYIQTLVSHLNKKHRRELVNAQLLGAEYAGMLSLTYFETADEAVAYQRDFVRWKVHCATRRAFVADDRIQERVETVVKKFLHGTPDAEDSTRRMMEPEGIGGMMTEVLREMRDVLEERGRYNQTTGAPAPEPPAEKSPAAV